MVGWEGGEGCQDMNCLPLSPWPVSLPELTTQQTGLPPGPSPGMPGDRVIASEVRPGSAAAAAPRPSQLLAGHAALSLHSGFALATSCLKAERYVVQGPHISSELMKQSKRMANTEVGRVSGLVGGGEHHAWAQTLPEMPLLSLRKWPYPGFTAQRLFTRLHEQRTPVPRHISWSMCCVSWQNPLQRRTLLRPHLHGVSCHPQPHPPLAPSTGGHCCTFWTPWTPTCPTCPAQPGNWKSALKREAWSPPPGSI